MNGPALLALQLVDSELDQLAARRQRLAERSALAAAESTLAGVLGEADRLRAAIADAASRIEQAERDGADIDRVRARLETQLKTVIAPREAEALTHEIDGARARRSAVDDMELEAMEQQADAEHALAAATESEREARAVVAAAAADLEAALDSLAAVEAEVQQRRTAAAAALDPNELDTYAAVRRRHGGVGFVRVEGRSCTGCHVDMSQAELEQVRAVTSELPECPNCGRLIVV
jgi:predicted  nucleic acid-binding Zn-ribbon protein